VKVSVVALVYKAWTKAIRSGGGPPECGADWISALRGWLKVLPEGIEFGDVYIAASEVKDAVLYEARQWLIVPVYILAVSTESGHWQFGLNPWTDVGPHLPFPYRTERVRLRYSKFSIAVRIILLSYLIFIGVRRIMGW
jgi:hypothetical protein